MEAVGKAICCTSIHNFSVIYHTITVSRLFFVMDFVSKQIFFCLECLNVNNRMFPLSVIMALGNTKFEETHKEQNFELRTGNSWKIY